MPLQATSGAASYDAFGGGVPVEPVYIEQIFSTFLYTGNNSTLSINNSIDLSTKGGLVWIKNRQQAAYYHTLVDTVRGPSNQIYSNATDAQYTATGFDVTAFTSTGFTLGTDSFCNQNNGKNVSWTFRKQPKFFDVVTYTGVGGNNRSVPHNLGSVPGCVIVKRTDSTGSWFVWHRSIGTAGGLLLNATDAVQSYYWDSADQPTSTNILVSNSYGTNANGATYVAYLFAHDAGGFGLTGTDNVISCGGFTTDSGGLATVTLGYEPQWLMIKRTGTTGDWQIMDTMRGFVNNSSGGDAVLKANSSDAESTFTLATPTSTGFLIDGNAANAPIIYIAIRRGPMKVPTSGTSVYNAIARTGTGAVAQVTGVGFSPDFSLTGGRSGSPYNGTLYDRLRGAGYRIGTRTTAAEGYDSDTLTSFNMNGVSLGADNFGYINTSGGIDYINWYFKRAPSFFDEVCYTGTGVARTVAHNLTVVPELMIVKQRNTANSWMVYSATVGPSSILNLNTTSGASGSSNFNNTNPTASVFSVGSFTGTNESGGTYVNYLFATCAGVSKVGSYTGNGTTQTIDCGFGAGGARFVLIKRTDASGDWYVYDTTRGMTTVTDPYLLLNTTAAEVATLGSVTTVSTGFALDSTILAAINVSGGSYIFLAVA